MTHNFEDEINIELDYLEATIAHLENLLEKISDKMPEYDEMAAIGTYLVNLYNGIENILKCFLRKYDIHLENSPNWHLRLLEMFGSEKHPCLPQIINEEMMVKLDAYRSFRHVFVHGYAILLRWDRLRPAAENASRIFRNFMKRVRDIVDAAE